MKFRDLTANEVDVRIGQVAKDGSYLTCLLYKDARADMIILDETVGAENWEREHYECKGNLFCKVGINCDFDKENSFSPNWVYKSDCGTESNTEKEKGESSDSFKRACTNFSIGRELYTSPFIWVKAELCKTYKKDTDKYGKPVYATNDRFSVEKIIIEDKKIKAISIVNETQKARVFVWQSEVKK